MVYGVCWVLAVLIFCVFYSFWVVLAVLVVCGVSPDGQGAGWYSILFRHIHSLSQQLHILELSRKRALSQAVVSLQEGGKEVDGFSLPP